MAGHKWALMIKAPTGEGSLTTLDRAGQAFLFTLIGPLLLFLSAIADCFWYWAHVFKEDLDKTEFAQAKKSNHDTLHRRSYKKMLDYFEKQNDRLVLLKKVSEDLRKYLDVEEGLRCLIFGYHDIFPQMVNLYQDYEKETKA